MGRSPCSEKRTGLKKGPWTPQEDEKLVGYIKQHGHGSWRSLPLKAGLLRCGKSCRLRWTNYLRPDIKRGKFSLAEEQTIIQLHALLGNRWSVIASQLDKRTDNEIKNHWNSHLKKRLVSMGVDPLTHKPTTPHAFTPYFSDLSHTSQWECARREAEARLASRKSLVTTNMVTSFRPHLPTNMFNSHKSLPLTTSPHNYFATTNLDVVISDNQCGFAISCLPLSQPQPQPQQQQQQQWQQHQLEELLNEPLMTMPDQIALPMAPPFLPSTSPCLSQLCTHASSISSSPSPSSCSFSLASPSSSTNNGASLQANLLALHEVDELISHDELAKHNLKMNNNSNDWSNLLRELMDTPIPFSSDLPSQAP